jgi:hypothetical protein
MTRDVYGTVIGARALSWLSLSLVYTVATV